MCVNVYSHDTKHTLMHRFFGSAQGQGLDAKHWHRPTGHAADRSLHLGICTCVVSAPADLASGEFTSGRHGHLGFSCGDTNQTGSLSPLNIPPALLERECQGSGFHIRFGSDVGVGHVDLGEMWGLGSRLSSCHDGGRETLQDTEK